MIETFRLANDAAKRKGLGQLHLESDSVVPDGAFSEMVEPDAAGSQIGITTDSLGLLCGKIVPVVAVHLNNKIVVRKIEVHEVGAKGFVALKLVASESERPGNKILQAGRLCKAVALLRAIATPSYRWAVTLNLKRLTADTTEHRHPPLSPFGETDHRTESTDATPNLVGHSVDWDSATRAGHRNTISGTSAIASTGAVRTRIGASVWANNVAMLDRKRHSADLAIALFHSIAIISQ